MISHFADWLDEAHDVHFDLESAEFAGALSDRKTGETISPEQVWPLLDGFFRGEMHRQTLVPGSAESPTSSSSPTLAMRLTPGGSTSSPATAFITRWFAIAAARGRRSRTWS